MIGFFTYWLSMICIVIALHSQRQRYKPGPRYPFPFANRKEWGARNPAGTTPLRIPVPYVHTYFVHVPYQCIDRNRCAQSMKYMQQIHQNVNGWDDIAYNFAIGGDNVVYEGRGWRNVGAHASGFNSNSISIALLVNANQQRPTEKQKATAKKLIDYGIRGRYIKPYYSLAGHQFHHFSPYVQMENKTDNNTVLNLNMRILGTLQI